MSTDNFTNVSKLIDAAKRTGFRIVAYRPTTHPKGEKILMDIRYGDPDDHGVILGKDTLIFIKDYRWRGWIEKLC